MRTSQVIFVTLTINFLSCTPTPKFTPLELESRNFLNEQVSKRTIYLSTSENNGIVEHLYYYGYPDTTNKYHFKVTLDSSNQLTYSGELLIANKIDTMRSDGIDNTVYRYHYNLENTFDEETDIYVNMGRIILTHSTAWGTKDLFNYDSMSMHLNNKIAANL